MVFSLQRRFLLFLFLPVILFFLIAGVASYMYARSYLLDQWGATAKVKLERTAHQIKMKLDSKRELIDLIVEAETIPDSTVTQAFLLQQLSKREGVSFVDIQTLPVQETNSGQMAEYAEKAPLLPVPTIQRLLVSRFVSMNQMRGHGMEHGERREEVHGKRMTRSLPALSFDESRNFLTIAKNLGGPPEKPTRKVVVTISFDSFMKGILEVGQWKGSYACLVKSDGTILAHTDPSMNTRDTLGKTGDPLEIKVLNEMKTRTFGTVLGNGNPPDWVIGFYKVPTTDWYLVLVSKGSVILAPIVRFRFNYGLAGFISLICVGLLIRWNTQPIARSVAEISMAAEEVEDGNYSLEVSEDRSDEIGLLKRRINKMIRGLRQRDLIERTFGRYVDKKVVAELLLKPESLQLGGKNQTVTIMMADLRGFTRIAEGMKPQEVITILNRYFSKMIQVIEEHKGIIVDFYGDGILIFFNGSDEDVTVRALDAVRCALAMQKGLETVSRLNLTEGLPDLHMGIGIHTGEVVVGNIGSEARAKYGIVGSPVNETDRIQSCAEGGTVLISDKTYQSVKGQVEVAARGEARLKGLRAVRELYAVETITV